MQTTPEQLLARLAELGIGFEDFHHAPVFTVEESRHLRGEIPGAHTKNLFLRDNKKTYFLVSLEEETAVDLKGLRHRIGARGGLSFGSPEALMERLGVRPGAVSPLCAINDPEGAVTVVLDAALTRAERIACHPLDNSRTLSLTSRDLLAFLRSTGHEPMIVDLGSAEPSGDPPAA